MRLSNKTALITGSTSGIGQAIAEAFAREGARVLITGRDEARGQAVVQGITSVGGQASFIRFEATDNAEIHRLAEAATAELGHIDILVNNAGIFTAGQTEATDEATFDAMMATNVKAPYFLTALIAPQMAERGSGKIINITTMVAHVGTPGLALYGATKAALTLLTKAWAAEYGPRGVNVNAISPGPVRTPMAATLGDAFEQMGASLPARRVARPEEIAAAALYLASDDAAFVHGATLPVDGGRIAV
ncbi:MAG: SDR family oxidoreductase [Ktedonobacterales bacterium]|nr:SDR family oxidoreductase [Ktedonobacterales bacterium]